MVGKEQSAVNKYRGNKKHLRKKFNKKVKKTQAAHHRHQSRTKTYLCTVCREPAQKLPCGFLKDTPEGEVRAGLGKWRCRTHGKCKVQVVTNIEQEKAA